VENVSQVNLTMTLVKKIIVNGPFRIGFTTTGFPSGSYSITAKALNGSFNLTELAIGF
jgi:tellurite resistance protein TehA-like permease